MVTCREEIGNIQCGKKDESCRSIVSYYAIVHSTDLRMEVKRVAKRVSKSLREGNY